MRDVVAIDENNDWAVGDYRADGDFGIVRRTLTMHHDGDAWSIVPSPNPACIDGAENVHLYGVDAAGPNDVWAVGEYQDTDGSHPLFLHWYGNEWTQIESPAGGSSLVAFSSDDVYAGGGSAVHWNGDSWNVVESFANIGEPSFHIAAIEQCNIWAAGREIINGDLLTFSAHVQPDELPGDLNGDGVVGVSDLLALLAAWGPCGEICPPDFDGSGSIDVGDLLILLGNWGK